MTEVVTLSPGRLGDADIEAWRELSEQAAEPNPFLRPEFVMAAAHAGQPQPELLVVRRGGDWIALLPFLRARHYPRIPLPCLSPWLPRYAFLATPLISAEHGSAGAGGLADAVLSEKRAAALILDPVEQTGAACDLLLSELDARGLTPTVTDEFSRAALRRRPEPTYLSEAMSGKSRKKLRASRRALAKQLGEEPVLADRTDDPEGPRAFMALEASGWKGTAGTALSSSPVDSRFFLEIARTMAAAGQLQFLALVAGDRAIAIQCNLIERNVLYAFKVAYDEEFAHFSPGAHLEVEGLEAFHRSSMLEADSCADPGNALIERLWPDRRRLQRLMIPTGAPYARLLPRLLRLDSYLARGARAVLRRPEGSQSP